MFRLSPKSCIGLCKSQQMAKNICVVFRLGCCVRHKSQTNQSVTHRDEAALGAGDVGVIEGEVHSAIRVSEQIQATHLAARVTLEVVIALL
jgi:hypothetical protein